MKVGILGGTFNPIHNGHITLGVEAARQLALNHVLVMPSANPPHKVGVGIADAKHRSAMVKLAVEPYPELVFSDFELQREGKIYSADTLALLKADHPENEYYFIIGADSLFSIEKWYHPERVSALCYIVAAGRNQQNMAALRKQKDYLAEKYDAKIELLEFPDIPISSTMIREKAAAGEAIDAFVPEAVAQYIAENNLYVAR